MLGKNKTAKRDLAGFADEYVARLKQKPGVKVVSERDGTFGGLPARILNVDITAPNQMIRHVEYITAVAADKFYTCTLSTYKTAVREDDAFVNYIESVRITMP